MGKFYQLRMSICSRITLVQFSLKKAQLENVPDKNRPGTCAHAYSPYKPSFIRHHIHNNGLRPLSSCQRLIHHQLQISWVVVTHSPEPLLIELQQRKLLLGLLRPKLVSQVLRFFRKCQYGSAFKKTPSGTSFASDPVKMALGVKAAQSFRSEGRLAIGQLLVIHSISDT